MIKTKRIYDEPAAADGRRVLVDRLWPRGVSKEKARLDLWFKDIAPSDELRRSFHHEAEKWPEFEKRYRAELAGKDAALAELRRFAKEGTVTLLYAALDKGLVLLVIIAVINAAIAVYYYLCVVREACFRDPGDRPPIRLNWSTRALCVLLIAGILALGIVPARVLDTLSTSVAAATGAPPPTTSVIVNVAR